jgi:hypothetical protein
MKAARSWRRKGTSGRPDRLAPRRQVAFPPSLCNKGFPLLSTDGLTPARDGVQVGGRLVVPWCHRGSYPKSTPGGVEGLGGFSSLASRRTFPPVEASTAHLVLQGDSVRQQIPPRVTPAHGRVWQDALWRAPHALEATPRRLPCGTSRTGEERRTCGGTAWTCPRHGQNRVASSARAITKAPLGFVCTFGPCGGGAHIQVH